VELTVALRGQGEGTITSDVGPLACKGRKCSVTVPRTAGVVALTATASPGSVFAGWSGGGCSGSSTCAVATTASTTVEATFLQALAIRVTGSGTGSGTVTGAATTCTLVGATTSCAIEVARTAPPQRLTLTATASPGSVFEGWGGACAGTGACRLTVARDLAVTVAFRATAYRVGGAVSGLTGGGLVLRDGGGGEVPLSADGPFWLPTAVAAGSPYDVGVALQPPGQTCVVANGAGVVGASDVTDVIVTCQPNRYPVGGTVAGVLGSGLVLRLNGGDDLPIAAPGAFSFPTPLATGSTYAVTVAAQPTAPSHTCVVANGAGVVGASDVRDVIVTCQPNRYPVGGTVAGVLGSGLVLRLNGGDDLPIAAPGEFSFPTPLATGSTYAVTVAAQPTAPSQTCVVANGAGVVGDAGVTGVVVTCTDANPRWGFFRILETPLEYDWAIAAFPGAGGATVLGVSRRDPDVVYQSGFLASVSEDGARVETREIRLPGVPPYDIPWAQESPWLRAATEDGEGGAFACGSFYSASGADALFVHVDARGEVVWARRLATDGSGDGECTGIARAPDGSLRVALTMGERVEVAALDPSDATPRWRTAVPGARRSSRVAIEAAGDVYVVGDTVDAADGPTIGGGDAFVARVNATGTLAWAHGFGTETCGSAGAGIVVGDRAVYALASGCEGGGGVLAAFDPDGLLTWMREVAAGRVSDVAVALDGTVVLVGSNRYVQVVNNVFRYGPETVFAEGFDGAGEYCWNLDFSATGDTVPEAVRLASDGSLWIVGYAFGGVVTERPPGTKPDAFVLKLVF
jgi:hypothetical protein